MDNTIQMNLFEYFIDEEKFSIQDATNLVKNIKNMQVNNESIRARIYEGVEKGIFTKISRGVYKVTSQIEGKENTCLLINGDGRDLSIIKDKSIDGIITDHPYDLQKALTGGNRKFATFELFRYESKDFKEKQRVLKEGAFLVEFLPEESEVNFDYLYEIKKMAEENGIYIQLQKLGIIDYFDFEKYGESFGYDYELLSNGYFIPNYDIDLDCYSKEEIQEKMNEILNEKLKEQEVSEIEI